MFSVNTQLRQKQGFLSLWGLEGGIISAPFASGEMNRLPQLEGLQCWVDPYLSSCWFGILSVPLVIPPNPTHWNPYPHTSGYDYMWRFGLSSE